MPWHTEQKGNEYCVIKDADGSTVACHPTKAEADDQVKALYANEPAAGGKQAARSFANAKIVTNGNRYCVQEGGAPPDCYDTRAEAEDALAKIMGAPGAQAADTGKPFTVFITVEGLETHDGRLFERGGLEPRATLPIPLMVQERAEHGGQGDTTSWFAGSIDEVFRDPRDDTRWMGRGHLMANENGKRAEELIQGGLKFVSVDASADDVTLDIRSIDSETGMPVDALYRYGHGRIMGATITPFPAFEQCTIWLDGEAEPDSVAATHGGDVELTKEPELIETEGPLLLLASGGGPARPPASWFENPKLRAETPLTIDDEGRVFGHIATWNTCHIGTADTCITAPTSPSSYAYFHTGEVLCATGERIAVGTLTLGTGHANIRDSASTAMAHYDHTGTGAVDMRCGDDDYGIWCAGAVRPHMTERDIRTLMAAAPSGDWRRINGFLELVAVLAVNVPGFPVPRTQARVASGAETALVAAPGPGIMAWQERFASMSGKTRDAFMSTLRTMISDMVKAALDSDDVTEEVAVEMEETKVRTAAEARRAHIVAPPLEPNADPRRAALEQRKREIKSATRTEALAAAVETKPMPNGNVKVGNATVQEVAEALDKIVPAKQARKPRARRTQ
jgi:hypothetical protein